MKLEEKVVETVCSYMVKLCEVKICGLTMSPCEINPQGLCKRIDVEPAEGGKKNGMPV